MVRSDDRVELISALRSSSGSFHRPPRNGIIFLALAFTVVLTVLFYICSIDYETLMIERKLLNEHDYLTKQQREELKWTEDELLPKNKKRVLGHDGHDLEDHEEGNSSYEERVRPAFEHPNTELPFKLEGSNDVLVFIQIQNSGSSNLERKITQDLKDASCGCEKGKCQCLRPDDPDEPQKEGHEVDEDYDEGKEEPDRETYSPNWLFSKKTMGWPCGVHAGWTEMTSCADEHLDAIERFSFKRRYFYMTQLRHPVRRFLSEYFRIQTVLRSNTSEVRMCRGQHVFIASCNFSRSSLTSIQEYINCPVNMAVNRQTKMLADMSLVNCYGQSEMSKREYDLILLSSAKANLHKTAFFALDEMPEASAQLFELTFDLSFRVKNVTRGTQDKVSGDPGVSQDNSFLHRQLRSVVPEKVYSSERNTHRVNKKKGVSGTRRKHYVVNGLPHELVDQVKEANALDMELYEYAKQVLLERLNRLRKQADEKEDDKSPDLRKLSQPVNEGELGEDVTNDKVFDIDDGEDDDGNDDAATRRWNYRLTKKLLRALNLSATELVALPK